MSATLAALLAILGALGYVLGLRRKAARAAAERDQQRARAETAEVAHAQAEQVRHDQAAGREAARAVANDAAVVSAPTPAAQVDAAIEALRKQRAAAEVRRVTGRAK